MLFKSAKSGLPVGVCCITIQPFPSELHSMETPFAILFLSHSQFFTLPSYFQVNLLSHTPQEIVKKQYMARM